MHEQTNQHTVSELKAVEEFKEKLNDWALLPLPYPPRPEWSPKRSPRLRQRLKRRLAAWRVTMGIVKTINGLDEGRVASKLSTPDAAGGRTRMKVTAARSLALQHLLREGATVARERRSLGLTGVQISEAVKQLLKQPMDELGYLKISDVKQVPLIADRIAEPACEASIDMLSALPQEDSCFYAQECNVVDPVGKCEVFFREAERHYGFIGGTEEEYLKYLGRDDVKYLWEWDTMDGIRAIAGVSAVPKKDPLKQRKLVMQVASNYMFADPSSRAHLGMCGGAALSRCFCPSDSMHVALCDEDSAFTFVKVPEWMSRWQGGPPVLAVRAWHLLPAEVKARIQDPSVEFVSPRYLRLAMGGSHSVYILMRINIEHIGRSLMQYVQDNSLKNTYPPASDNAQAITGEPRDGESTEILSDEAWSKLQDKRKGDSDTVGASGYTVQGWCDEVRRVKQLPGRTMVIMHFFAGDRRPGDIEEHVRREAEKSGLRILFIGIDLATDANWDFTIPRTFHMIMNIIEEGLVDVAIGGPPCSTVARVRHVRIPSGPRPLRFRWCVWGRADLRPYEQARVDEANTLWLNYMAVCEAVSSRGGVHWWERPADPGRDPYPSIWITEEMIGLERRTGATRAIFHQCPFGGEVPKLTCFSGTVMNLSSLNGIFCPGVSETHSHGQSMGRDPMGGFSTRRLQAYPSDLCLALAKLLVYHLLVLRDKQVGPTGALCQAEAVPVLRVPAWSTWASQRGEGVVLLNEASTRSQSARLSPTSAVYVHVDDTVCISDGGARHLDADNLMGHVVSSLEAIGFGVSQQEKNDEVKKVVGYEVSRHPASFKFPTKKMVLLADSLKYLTSRKKVQVKVLRSLLGLWIFGALLRRELLSIPHSVFQFIEEFDGQTVTWWPSVREEVIAMARVVPLMSCHVGASFLKWLFATDAMGMNDVDLGGYGIVMTPLSDAEIEDVLRQGESEGRSIARLDGTGGAKFPDKALKPTVPFTLLPDSLLTEDRWHFVEAGRWQFGDHITVGESRTVVRLLRMLASSTECHDKVVFSLQDNKPTAYSMAKGRSPSFALNRVLRKKAGICLASRIRLFLPWLESGRQPADEASRLYPV